LFAATLSAIGFPQFTFASCRPFKWTGPSSLGHNEMFQLVYKFTFTVSRNVSEIKFSFREEIGHMLGNGKLKIYGQQF